MADRWEETGRQPAPPPPQSGDPATTSWTTTPHLPPPPPHPEFISRPATATELEAAAAAYPPPQPEYLQQHPDVNQFYEQYYNGGEGDPQTVPISRDATNPNSALLQSTILNYRRENGRTYHRLSDGKYALPNDALEQERLDIVNHLWMLTFDGAYCLCPKNDGARRVLDLGTGTGVWALDYADEFPQATVIGVDLSPIQPLYVPPNCHFEVDDLEKEWTWTEPFDFIFARNMIGCFSNWPAVIAQAYKALEPGGYFEIHDSIYPILCDDGTLTEDMPLSRWSRMLMEACEKVGRPMNITDQFPRFMEEVGFEGVTTKKLRFPASPWPDDPKEREMGLWTQASLMPGLEGMSLALFTRVLEWSKNETIVFCAHVREDVRNTNLHGYWDGYAIYGRKPLDAPFNPS